METKYDYFLKQLGITQWTLRRPEVLHGAFAVKLPKHIRLLLVGNPAPAVDHRLVADVAHSMKLKTTQLYGMTPEQVMSLSDSVRCHCWWFGLSALRDFHKISLHTPPLAALLGDANAKRELWLRISNIVF
ncbi:DNA polymerase III subunit psi [Sodalis endosymbiont of Henestaris halophilus]|uniref:DNA polymerase III subunit psi n=1 Tax=Sodalis endosymbiont of Henestaris halophilus TaxID=1929246 RepID=UPI000BC04433|nr:DNA polymerase III subunit psi [Sodalis endosymbiont of Henestaris halophilus]SNC58584.1 DNA polymerase III subunit psi [Sodalis endosymbiont of Henestaris halophilus]